MANKRMEQLKTISEQNLRILRSDFGILVESEVILCKLLAVADDTEHCIDAVCYSIANIEDKLNNPNIQIPEIKTLVDFDELGKNGFLGYVSRHNELCHDQLQSVCPQIDEAKKYVAEQIKINKDNLQFAENNMYNYNIPWW